MSWIPIIAQGLLQGGSLFKGRKVWVILQDLKKSFLRLNNLMIFKIVHNYWSL